MRDIEDIINSVHISGSIAYDMFSGIGTFSVMLAKYFKKVIAIDNIKEVELKITENCKLNNVDNVKSINSNIYKSEIKGLADLIIIDPPRAGLDEKLISKIIDLKSPYIMYLSCNPISQIRDMEILSKVYKIIDIISYNFYPHTPHIENLLLLRRI